VVAFDPKRASSHGRIDPDTLPPSGFIPTSMNLAVMTAAEWKCEVITDLRIRGPFT
jgi:hypothetical protein